MARGLPGQSGNPNGRPRRGQALTDAILQFSRQKITVGEDDDEPTTMQRRDALALLLWQRALGGDHTAQVLVLAAIRFCSIGLGVPSVMIPPVDDLDSPYLDSPFYDRWRREPWAW